MVVCVAPQSSNEQCRVDPPAHYPPSMGEQWQHQHCPPQTPPVPHNHVVASLVLLSWPDRHPYSVCLRNKVMEYQLRLPTTKASCKIRKCKFYIHLKVFSELSYRISPRRPLAALIQINSVKLSHLALASKEVSPILAGSEIPVRV